jgi:hypothetical protein
VRLYTRKKLLTPPEAADIIRHCLVVQDHKSSATGLETARSVGGQSIHTCKRGLLNG